MSDKRTRSRTAQPLPDGIMQEMIPKYVIYVKEVYNKEKNLSRDYFRIDGHPRLGKSHDGIKSMKKTIIQKLEEIRKVIHDLDNNVLPQTQKEKIGLPVGISISTKNDKQYLCYDRRTNTGRQNMKMTLPKEYNIQEQLKRFQEKIATKYSDDS